MMTLHCPTEFSFRYGKADLVGLTICFSRNICQTLMEIHKVLSWGKMGISDIWCSPQAFSFPHLLKCLLPILYKRWGLKGEQESDRAATWSLQSSRGWRQVNLWWWSHMKGAAIGEARGMMRAHVLGIHLRLWGSGKASWRKQAAKPSPKGWIGGEAEVGIGERKGQVWRPDGREGGPWLMQRDLNLEWEWGGAKERALLKSLYFVLGAMGSSDEFQPECTNHVLTLIKDLSRYSEERGRSQRHKKSL